MSADEGQDRGGDLRQDDLIERLIPNPNQMPHFTVLDGFLGRSSQEGFWRLYLTPALNDYLEFSADDLVHHERLPSTQPCASGTRIWLKQAAIIQRVKSAPSQMHAEFLQGDVLQTFDYDGSATPENDVEIRLEVAVRGRLSDFVAGSVGRCKGGPDGHRVLGSVGRC